MPSSMPAIIYAQWLAGGCFWALLDAGHFGYGHQHEDKLNLLLHAYGRLLLTEGGDYAYDDSEMRRYVLSTRAHNTIRVDGQDQNRRRTYSRDTFDVTQPSDGKLRITPHVDVAEGCYTEGYGPSDEHWLRHERKVIAFKQGIGMMDPCLVVIDRLIPRDEVPRRVQMLWHLNTESVEVSQAAAFSRDAGQPNLAILPAHEAELDVRVVSGQETPEWQGWKSILDYQQGEYAPTPTIVCERTIQSATRIVTVLYPTPAGVVCPVKSVSAGTGIQDTGIALSFDNCRVLQLDEKDY